MPHSLVALWNHWKFWNSRVCRSSDSANFGFSVIYLFFFCVGILHTKIVKSKAFLLISETFIISSIGSLIYSGSQAQGRDLKVGHQIFYLGLQQKKSAQKLRKKFVEVHRHVKKKWHYAKNLQKNTQENKLVV